MTPPHAVIDDGSDGLRHAALGHHFRWSPPTPQEAGQALTAAVGPASGGEVEELRVIRNSVRLGLETALILITGGVLLVIVRRTERRED
jgi:hypothetical protein